MTVEQMLKQIRRIIAECNAPEKEVYDALVDESEGWAIRLEELDEEADSND